jgi:hypothetical protein
MSSGVLLPGGLLAPDPALETYRVQPGGATEVRLGGDDRLRIVDRHGGQEAVLTGALEAVGLKDGRLFGPESRPGSEVELTADREAQILVAAPGFANPRGLFLDIGHSPGLGDLQIWERVGIAWLALLALWLAARTVGIRAHRPRALPLSGSV